MLAWSGSLALTYPGLEEVSLPWPQIWLGKKLLLCLGNEYRQDGWSDLALDTLPRHFAKDEDQLSSKGKSGELFKTEDLFQGIKDVPLWGFFPKWNGFLMCVPGPGADSCNQTITWEKTMLILTFAAVTVEVRRWELLTAALECQSIGHSYGVLCLAAWSKEREEYMGKLESCQLWPFVVALKPSACLQTFLCRQHIGSMDDCGLELVWEIPCNSINILSLHIAADSVKRTKVMFCFAEVSLQIPVIRNLATKHWNISNRIIWKAMQFCYMGFMP